MLCLVKGSILLLNVNNLLVKGPSFPQWIIKISLYAQTRPAHCWLTKSLHRTGNTWIGKQKANLITHTHTLAHTRESTRRSRHVAQTPSPLPLPFSSIQPPNPLRGQRVTLIVFSLVAAAPSRPPNQLSARQRWTEEVGDLNFPQ